MSRRRSLVSTVVGTLSSVFGCSIDPCCLRPSWVVDRTPCGSPRHTGPRGRCACGRDVPACESDPPSVCQPVGRFSPRPPCPAWSSPPPACGACPALAATPCGAPAATAPGPARPGGPGRPARAAGSGRWRVPRVARRAAPGRYSHGRCGNIAFEFPIRIR